MTCVMDSSLKKVSGSVQRIALHKRSLFAETLKRILVRKIVLRSKGV